MHIVTMSLRRDEPTAVTVDADAFAHAIMRTAGLSGTEPTRVEHARVVPRVFHIDIVMFVLAPTYLQAHTSALRICRRALDSATLTGWVVEDRVA